jgi:hypothetical protein
MRTPVFILTILVGLHASAFGVTGNDDSSRWQKAGNTATVLPSYFKSSIVAAAYREYDRWHNGATIRESDSAAATMVQEYWKVVGKQFRYKNFKDSTWQEKHPWSAVFISYVLKQAGAGDQFRYSETHSSYIVWARQNASAAKQEPMFAAFPVEDSVVAWPQPGDIVCKNRDGKNYSLNDIGEGCISHCDIVVAVDTLARAIYTIGGNVNNTVSKRLVWLDERGRIDPKANWMILDEELGNKEGSQSEYFAVIKVRQQSETWVYHKVPPNNSHSSQR